ncbi:MAG: GTP-binding protein [Cyclobacteriaceae bacterium]|nr:MAG: GTP-binding protein [Cyclobacteriaceae bacterium]
MSHEIIQPALRSLRARLSESIKSLHELVQRTNNPDLTENISDLRERIQEPFMFVIVGEVKSGKSSFVNALLNTGEDICKVAPDPCTDTIQQVLYGEEDVVVVNEYLKKIYHPVGILKEIAIVDTPGTNTIIQHHQEITERFIPVSDLIVFVFEAKNPYRQSAWEFFDYISVEWRKKVIFILQQADLMEDEDLKINIEGVTRQAEKKGVNHPQVFAVSAKQAMAGDIDGSGMGKVIDYINANVTGGRAPWLKLENNLTTLNEIMNKIGAGLHARKDQLLEDQRFREEVIETLQSQGRHSKNQVKMLVENMVAVYDRITAEAKNDLSRGLGFFTLVKRSFLSMFSKKESATGWLSELTEKMETSLKQQLTVKVNEGVVSVADSIQQMAKIIQLKIQNSKTILKGNQGIFDDISEKRVQVMHDLQQAFSEFLNRTENFVDERMIPKDSQFTPDLAKGGGLAVIGVVMATVTKSMAFDITGGILSAVGILFAGITVGIKRHKVLNSFTFEVARGRKALEEDISEKLGQYVDTIEKRIDQNFQDFDAMIQLEGHETSKLTEMQSKIESQLAEIESDLKQQSV